MSRQLTGTDRRRPSARRGDRPPPSKRGWRGAPRRGRASSPAANRPPRAGRPSRFSPRASAAKAISNPSHRSRCRSQAARRMAWSRKAADANSPRRRACARPAGVAGACKQLAVLGREQEDQAIDQPQQLAEEVGERQLLRSRRARAAPHCRGARNPLPSASNAASTPSRSRSRAASPSLLAGLAPPLQSAIGQSARRARRSGWHGSAARARRNRRSRRPRRSAADQPRYRRGG